MWKKRKILLIVFVALISCAKWTFLLKPSAHVIDNNTESRKCMQTYRLGCTDNDLMLLNKQANCSGFFVHRLRYVNLVDGNV